MRCVMRPCIVTGNAISIGPLVVPVSRSAEKRSGTMRLMGPFTVSTSSPSPDQRVPASRTERGPLVVRPRTSPPESVIPMGPLTEWRTIRPWIPSMETPPFTACAFRSSFLGAKMRYETDQREVLV